MAETQTVTVETKPWYESKINWTQFLGLAASFATLFGFTVPPELITTTVAVIAGVQGLITIVFKTWFTPTITPASAAKMTLD